MRAVEEGATMKTPDGQGRDAALRGALRALRTIHEKLPTLAPHARSILLACALHDGGRLDDARRDTGIERDTFSRALRSLQRLRYVRVTIDPVDARYRLVHLQERGRGVVAGVVEALLALE
jgi:DNA-binding MarR family transcriptional regulator